MLPVQTSSEAVSLPYQERLRWTNASSPSDFGWGSTYEGVDKAAGLLSVERIRARNTQSASASSHSEVSYIAPSLTGILLFVLSRQFSFFHLWQLLACLNSTVYW